MRRSALYRVFNAEGALLYAGVTANPIQRAGGHQSQSDWFHEAARIEIEWFDSRADAFAAEVAVIREERPRYNTSLGRAGKRPNGTYTRSAGAVALAQWLAANDLDVQAAAVRFGMPFYLVDRAVRGKRPPNEADAARIEQITGGAVPAPAWNDPA